MKIGSLIEQGVTPVLDQSLAKRIRLTNPDSGPGIPPALRPLIMEPFFTTKEVGKGTGLGLSISKGLAEAHDGHLTLDPTSRNTRFVLALKKSDSRL